MKKKRQFKFVIVVSVFMIVFFAIVTTNFRDRKNVDSIGSSEVERFTKNIKFSKNIKREPYMEFNGKASELENLIVSNNGRELIFETPLFEKVGDKAVIHYWITNENGENARIGNLICKSNLVEDSDSVEENKNDENYIENYISIKSNDELKNKIVSGGETTDLDATIELELIKPYMGLKEKLTYQISCILEATKE